MLKDFEFSGGNLVARPTGAEIPVNATLVRDVARGARFVFSIQALSALRAAMGRKPRASIAFFPQKPRSYYAIWPVCRLADVKIVDRTEDADVLFYFEDSAFKADLSAPPASVPVLNGACTDVRKSKVQNVFEDVFGYALAVDPRGHQGPMLAKSEGNGVHDGRIIEGPIDRPKPGFVYQRLVENTVDGREYVDIRTPVVGGRIPFVYLKKRMKDVRISNDNHSVDFAETDDMLTAEEQEKIIAVANAMGLDFGGLDVLRDRADGRIYIVDVNKTDMGPPTALDGAGKLKAMKRLADAFSAMLDDKRIP